MKTTILYRDYMEVILGIYWDNGKENGNYYIGLYMDLQRHSYKVTLSFLGSIPTPVFLALAQAAAVERHRSSQGLPYV